VDQRVFDPQSWNLYGYVRNNPLVQVDPSGKACTSINQGGAFCGRSFEYGQTDQRLAGKTRFFAAASAVNRFIANVDNPGAVEFTSLTLESKTFMEAIGTELKSFNKKVVGAIDSGFMTRSGS
jgi:hypothetical protein